jgi:hypothetical protein
MGLAIDFQSMADLESRGAPYGWLHEFRTGIRIRPATEVECDRACRAAVADGGVGAIIVSGLVCVVVC